MHKPVVNIKLEENVKQKTENKSRLLDEVQSFLTTPSPDSKLWLMETQH